MFEGALEVAFLEFSTPCWCFLSGIVCVVCAYGFFFLLFWGVFVSGQREKNPGRFIALSVCPFLHEYHIKYEYVNYYSYYGAFLQPLLLRVLDVFSLFTFVLY